MPPQELKKDVWLTHPVSSFRAHKFSPAFSVAIHWEYNSQHVTCQELEKILYSQMISHYLSYRALKYEAGEKEVQLGV